MITLFAVLLIGLALGELGGIAVIILGYKVPPPSTVLLAWTVLTNLAGGICLLLIAENVVAGEDMAFGVHTLTYAILYVLTQFLAKWTFAFWAAWDFVIVRKMRGRP